MNQYKLYRFNEKPADYLGSFNHFIRDQLNQSVALGVIVNKPKILKRFLESVLAAT